MRPTIDDFLKGSARWRGQHQGIDYELSWHGLSEYSPEGTWCWYIMARSEQFAPADWEKLRLRRDDKEFAGSWRRHWDYDNFPDIEAHGGWTFGEMETYLGKDGKEYEFVKVGCDYAHLFDREGGYWEGRDAVERDCKRSIDLLCKMFPQRRECCAYCGIYDESDQFYTSRSGARVHKTQIPKLQETGWEAWLPAEAA